MRYLGGLTGRGVLKYDGEEIAHAFYDFDTFLKKSGDVTSCGEIGASSAALQGVFGRKDIQLLTEDDRLLDLKFSQKALLPANDVAHVDVTGELPIVHRNWGHRPPPATTGASSAVMATRSERR